MPEAEYDTIPDSFWEDPKRIWQAQITGEKNFDCLSFMGALNDLQGVPDWREAFKGIEYATGMPEFLDRLQAHFDLCVVPKNSDGSWHVYQHPSRANSNEPLDKNHILSLVKRHLNTWAEALKKSKRPEDAAGLSEASIKWLTTAEDFDALDWREQLAARHGRPFKANLLDAWDFELSSEYFPNHFKDGVPDIISELEESVYTLANDFGLQRYLLQSFTTHGLDVDALYEIEWVHRCIFFFDETTCYVTSAKD